MNSAARMSKLVELTPEFVRRYDELQHELEKSRQSAGSQTNGVMEELRREIARLTDEGGQLKTAVAGNVATEVHSETDKIGELKSRLATVEQDSAALQKTLKNVKSKLAVTESELLKIRLERDAARKEKQALNADRKKLQEELSKHESAGHVGDSEDIGFLKSEISDKKKQLDELKLKNALQAMQISKLKG